uniref:Uncharacterized protein n=1 Tax=Anguilla anguilla TaxID=7936 RepID=A0A0E9RIB3_ANGAN
MLFNYFILKFLLFKRNSTGFIFFIPSAHK